MSPLPGDIVLLQSLYRLSDYPVLAAIAHEQSKATKLDGRTCKMLYLEALPSIDLSTVSESELGFMHRLGVC